MFARPLLAAVFVLAATAPVRAQIAAATYEFQNSYAADEAGRPALTPYAPGTGTLAFTADTVSVGSQSVGRTVLARGGTVAAVQANQAGVELTTSSLLTNPNLYSVEMVFSMSTSNGSYQRLLTSNNASDNGLYAVGGVL